MTDEREATTTDQPGTLTVDGLELYVSPFGTPEADRLVLVKPMSAVDEYHELMRGLAPRHMVELGIAYGGSVAFHALSAQPDVFVALELATERVRALDELLQERDLTEKVQLHYGVDQADAVRVRTIVESALDGRPLDLVIDDASHLYEPTVSSFETLFPLLRPGGMYVVEDWSCDHDIRTVLASAVADETSPLHGWAQDVVQGVVRSFNEGEPAQTEVARASLGYGSYEPGTEPRPLSRLASELVLGPIDPASGIASVSVNAFWIAVERSDAPIDPGSFSLAGACADPFRTLAI